MATLLEETFEGNNDGYDNDGWAESVGAGCTVNQDSSMPSGSNASLGSECLFCEADDQFESANTKYTLAATTNVSYIRIYFYINSLGVTGAETCRLMELYNDELDIPVYCNLQAGPVLYVYFYSDGDYVSHNMNVSASTWYCLELKYDTSANTYEWKLNGASQNSGSLVNPYANMELLLLGIIQYGGTSAASSFYIDAVKWSGSEWPGTLYSSMTTEKRNKNAVKYLLMLDEMRGNPGTMGGMKWI